MSHPSATPLVRRPCEVANSLRMKRTVDPNMPIVLVEGNDDELLWKRHLQKLCRTIVCHGRPNALAILNEFDKPGAPLEGCLAIVDSDFWHLNGNRPEHPDICCPLEHDIECCLLCSPAMDHVLLEFGDAELLERFESTRGSPREYLASVGSAIGRVRWASDRLGWSLKFEGLRFEKFISEKTLALDNDGFVAELLGHQGGRTAPLPMPQTVDAELTRKSPATARWQLCCGHDLCQIMSIALRRVWGKRRSAEVLPERIEQSLRLAFEREYLENSSIYPELLRWEAQRGLNRYRILG